MSVFNGAGLTITVESVETRANRLRGIGGIGFAGRELTARIAITNRNENARVGGGVGLKAGRTFARVFAGCIVGADTVRTAQRLLCCRGFSAHLNRSAFFRVLL